MKLMMLVMADLRLRSAPITVPVLLRTLVVRPCPCGRFEARMSNGATLPHEQLTKMFGAVDRNELGHWWGEYYSVFMAALSASLS
jgi:hypothetical protein